MASPAEHPFDGYTLYVLYHKREGRNMAQLVSKEHRTTMSYARYLYSVKEGRMLSKLEQVDHIDNDKTNDAVENLRILTARENSIKQGMLMRKSIHGSLSCYRYCKCNKCKLGKSLYSRGNIDEYKKLIA